MKIKEYIKKIVDNGKQEEMQELSNMLEETLEKIKSYDESCYKKYKLKLLGMAYDYKFNEELAEEIVDSMKPLGEYWDLETTTQVKNQFGINANEYDFYLVMNSLANDYGEILDLGNVETYVKMANAFINDTDAVDNKVWKYYTTIVKKN